MGLPNPRKLLDTVYQDVHTFVWKALGTVLCVYMVIDQINIVMYEELYARKCFLMNTSFYNTIINHRILIGSITIQILLVITGKVKLWIQVYKVTLS